MLLIDAGDVSRIVTSAEAVTSLQDLQKGNRRETEVFLFFYNLQFFSRMKTNEELLSEWEGH